MIKQWSLKKIEISFFASTKKRILNRNSLKNFVAYFYKLFDINLISRFPKPVQTTDLEISFFSKKKGKKKRKKEKEKIQRQVQKKKTVSPYLAHGTRVASSIKVSTSAGRNDNSQFSPTTVSRCAASRRRKGCRILIGGEEARIKGDVKLEKVEIVGDRAELLWDAGPHCDSCAEQIARIEWGRT